MHVKSLMEVTCFATEQTYRIARQPVVLQNKHTSHDGIHFGSGGDMFCYRANIPHSTTTSFATEQTHLTRRLHFFEQDGGRQKQKRVLAHRGSYLLLSLLRNPFLIPEMPVAA